MRRWILSLVGLGLASTATADEPPARLRRADSFFGLHLDFHAGPDSTEIGRNLTREMIETLIDQTRPDFLQVDCKGHVGLSSYPTKVGYPAPGFVGDPLRLWRDVTAAHGVALYLHYSGVWDSEAIRHHPEWATVDAAGKADPNATSLWGGYADGLLLPQLRELASVYQADGVWIDGDCWAVVPDYSERALAAFRAATGIEQAPRSYNEPHGFEFLQFQRAAYRRYLAHVVGELKHSHPRFQVCSNWAFTDHMAEPVSVPVDFLSGDYSPKDSLNSARLSARYLLRQGLPWDLMAWGFCLSDEPGGRSWKSVPQLQREAAVVLALGGSFQAYFPQKRDGSIYLEHVPTMAALARFCRERQEWCHRAEPVPQVAVLLSTAGHYRAIDRPFNRKLGAVRGVLQVLLESQQVVEVVGEHQLTGRMQDYPLIVVPEWEYLEPAFCAELAGYVNRGGNLLLVGAGTASWFEKVWHRPLSGLTRLGRGSVGALRIAVGEAYARDRRDELRRRFMDAVTVLFPEPIVNVKGSRNVDVILMKKAGQLLVHFVNTSGPHQREAILTEVSPVGPLKVTMRVRARPAGVRWLPGGETMAFEYADGKLVVDVPRVDLHGALVVE